MRHLCSKQVNVGSNPTRGVPSSSMAERPTVNRGMLVRI